MNQTERRQYLINRLLKEHRDTDTISISFTTAEQKRLLRTLFNLRMPKEADAEFLHVQDAYLRCETEQKGITDIVSLKPVREGTSLYIWQGDITTLRCGAIVNAANSQLLGCFYPCHGCIDNAIHTFAGVQLRYACAELMKEQGYDEPVGQAKVTPAFNLPCDYVIHTVGPTVQGHLTNKDCRLLASCYHSCLEAAVQNGIESIAFCCISTGEFHFPNQKAAEIAVQTVKAFLQESKRHIKVIFNVFQDIDCEIYTNLLL